MQRQQIDEFEIEFAKNGPFNSIIELIKSQFDDINIEILHNKELDDDENLFSGIRIEALSQRKTVYVNIMLDKHNQGFKLFNIISTKDQINIGISINKLHQKLSLIDKNESFKLILNSLTSLKLVATESDAVHTVNILDLNNIKRSIKKFDYDCEIKFNFDFFRNICKKFKKSTEIIEIEVTQNDKGQDIVVLQIIQDNEGSRQICVHSADMEKKQHVIINKSTDKPIRGMFQLEYLDAFTKCNLSCETITIMISNNRPLKLCYTIADIGYANIYITQIDVSNDAKMQEQTQFSDVFNTQLQNLNDSGCGLSSCTEDSENESENSESDNEEIKKKTAKTKEKTAKK